MEVVPGSVRVKYPQTTVFEQILLGLGEVYRDSLRVLFLWLWLVIACSIHLESHPFDLAGCLRSRESRLGISVGISVCWVVSIFMCVYPMGVEPNVEGSLPSKSRYLYSNWKLPHEIYARCMIRFVVWLTIDEISLRRRRSKALPFQLDCHSFCNCQDFRSMYDETFWSIRTSVCNYCVNILIWGIDC
jgi:hypothetical protein